jgi:membrane fusion protein
MLAEPGMVIEPKGVGLSISSLDGRLVVKAAVPSTYIRYAKVGEQTAIRFDAFPYQTYGQSWGKICQLSLAPLALPNGSDRNNMLADTSFNITVCPNKKTLPVEGNVNSSALGLHATIVLKGPRKKIYEWIFNPFFEFYQNWEHGSAS